MTSTNFLYNTFIVGSLGHDSILGSDGLDNILGLAGNDTINGRSKYDFILGGSGDDSLIGEAGSDFLIGGHGEDTLDGGDDDDNLHGGNGADTLFGFLGNDILNGGSGDDSLNGGEGNDTLKSGVSVVNTNFLDTSLEIVNLASTNLHQVHSQMHRVFSSIDFLLALHDGDSRLSNSQILSSNLGNDTLDGGDGYDTADYTSFGQAVTLTPTGIVEKANGHSDLLIGIEKIVGAAGQENKIDALTAGDTVSLNVDLLENRLTVKDIPGLGDLNFDVEHFRQVSGTNQGDIFRGDSHDNILEVNDGNDFIHAGLGNDTVDGGEGYDTADYTTFGQAVTVTPTGIVEKANGQSDLLINIEKIVGAVGQENKIDAIAAGGTISLDVDLSTNRIIVNGIPGLGAFNFEVENFPHVSGTNQDDNIIGDFHNNILEGYDGNDTLDGGDGYDIVDYTDFGQAVTITPTGIVEKANGKGDLLIDIEKIVGAAGQENKIDALTAGDTVSLNVDLAANSLTVKDIPGLGDLNFDVEHFRQVSGTNQDDIFRGNSHDNILEGYDGNDFIHAGLGNDTVDGGESYDTVDYTSFGQAVTITPTGIVEKANGQSDLLINIEKIVGAVGQDNKIEAVTAGATISLNVDLAANKLTVQDIPGLGDLNFEVENFRDVSGTNQNDIIIGNSHDNILEGYDGFDTLDGGAGYDTVDYTGFGQAVTLTAIGIVEKSNEENPFGASDLLVDIEEIIGAAGQENKINAIAAGNSASIDADLSANRLTVKGIAELGELNFEVKNFRQVFGTNQDDIFRGDSHDNVMKGNDGNDIIYGGEGHDTLNGGDEFDTIDYTEFGEAITLTPVGVIEKANGQSDLLVGVERIVGAIAEPNKIDASSAPGNAANINVDLSSEQLKIENIPVLGEQDFQVVNFRHVSGTHQDDIIIGDSHENILEGNGGDDVLIGSSQNYYSDEIDTLTGGSGADRFVLGDAVKAYYQGDGFAEITDFASGEGDQLVAFGAAEDYTVSEFEGGTNVAYQGDIVAFVTNTTDVDLYSDFDFV